MSDAFPKSGPPPRRGKPEDRIRVIQGHLAGMTGVIIKSAERGRQLVKLDGLAEGAFVVLKDECLQVRDRPKGESRVWRADS